MKHLVAPSLLAADFTRLAEEIRMVNESQADWLHLDVMDGRFVPNITFGPMVVEAANRLCTKPLDVHLMIQEPEKYIGQFREAGADVITVHYEACPHLHRTVQQIRETGAIAGVSINPHNPVSLLEDILEEVGLVLLMSVNPGFGGQKFIYNALLKIQRLRDRLTTRNLSARIEVDGGIGLHNAEKVLQAGADVLVAGSAIFKADDPKDTIRRFKEIGGEMMKFV
ncbi:MAG: ribulose-phosphate 3-epimerase [Lewinellaceae bacterium]|nr:ribulose-phosphate 3-epimerase [Lewinellaceae bacterium]